jgi:hypothetical protein
MSCGRPSAGDFIDRAHGQSISVGVDQVPVDPGLGLGRELVYHQFPCGQHDLAILLSIR